MFKCIRTKRNMKEQCEEKKSQSECKRVRQSERENRRDVPSYYESLAGKALRFGL